LTKRVVPITLDPMRELFLTSFDGIQYGIWSDEILAVRDMAALHRIPLSPARIAGIMIEDGRTVTLADLPACVGHEPTRGKEHGCILLKQESDNIFGFVVGGELRTQSISPALVFPLPDYLKTRVFDTCAVHEGISIPVINIAELYSGVLKAGDEYTADSSRIFSAQSQEDSGSSRVRIFFAAGELFAVPATGIDEHAVRPGPVTPLPNTPQYVQGVTFHNGRLLTVIDLARRIKSQRVAPDPLMLTAEIADSAFGLLIESDTESLPADKVSIKPVPKIAWNSWLKKVVVLAGELIPLVDIAIALDMDAREADNMPVWQRYAPDSSFPEVFFRHDAEVVEFSLLGERYALPKQEVEDVIAFKSFRALPDVPPMVIGLAEHHGEILPVIDLAMMFGRRSLVTSGWRMMLVKNGDFRALVITETVFGERSIPVEMHRAVPIHLPHNLMYGCYPDEKLVRLILNVEEISVHFEKSLIQVFMPALSQQMRMSPTGVVYTFPEDITDQAEKAGPFENAEPEGKIEEVPLILPTEPQGETSVQECHEAQPVEEDAGFSGESKNEEFIAAENTVSAHTGMADASSQAVPEYKGQEEIGDAEFVEWEEEKAIFPIAAQPVQIDAVDATVSDQPTPPVTAKTAAGTPEPTLPERDVAYRGLLAETANANEPGKQSPLAASRASTRKQQAQNAADKVTIDKRSAEPLRATTSDKNGVPYRMSREVEQLATLSGNERIAASSRKRGIAYGAIVALLIAIPVYYVGISGKPAVENSIRATEPAKIVQLQPEQAKEDAVLARTRAEPAMETAGQASRNVQVEREVKTITERRAMADKTETLVLSPLAESRSETLRSAEQLRAPLELDIPKNRPTDIDVYVVQEGDTLWGISERFTGNPFNYPRIAGENRIADPDLIFPEQQIRLIK